MKISVKYFLLGMVIGIGCLVMAGCGQTGPLYLPHTDTNTKSA